jgi:hypothetical protein
MVARLLGRRDWGLSAGAIRSSHERYHRDAGLRRIPRAGYQQAALITKKSEIEPRTLHYYVAIFADNYRTPLNPGLGAPE